MNEAKARGAAKRIDRLIRNNNVAMTVGILYPELRPFADIIFCSNSEEMVRIANRINESRPTVRALKGENLLCH